MLVMSAANERPTTTRRLCPWCHGTGQRPSGHSYGATTTEIELLWKTTVDCECRRVGPVSVEADFDELTTNQLLAARGLAKREVHGTYEYVDAAGKVVFVGNVFAVGAWMRAGCPVDWRSWLAWWQEMDATEYAEVRREREARLAKVSQ